jgi:hypothetical protein
METTPDFLAQNDLLYKYYAFNERTRQYVKQVLAGNKVYFPTPTEFNDPFDSKIRPSFEGTEEEWKTWLMGALERRCPHMGPTQRLRTVERAARERRFSSMPKWVGLSPLDKMGVFCISKRCDHLLMWSHYAESHTGLCVAFNANNEFFGQAQEIKYREGYPKFRYLDASQEELTEATLLTKADVWSYEEEWRVIEYTTGPGIYPFPPGLLVAVILGCRMIPTDKHLMCQWCARRCPRPKIFQARVAEGEFRLDLIDITATAYL